MELRNRYAVFISLIALLAGLIIALRVSSYSFLRLKYLPSSELLLKANLGHKNTLADYYFLNAIQYGGEPKNKDEEYRWLYPMLNIVTELDPKYGTPYRWGGIVLPFFNGTEWKNVQESDMLLEKGIRDARKDEDKYWQVYFYRGWNAMTYEKDFRRAGDYIGMASRYVKGNVYPKYLALLATKLYATADDPDAGLRFAEDAYNVERDPDIKKELERRIKELRVEKDLKLLNSAIEELYKKSGKKPAKLEELINAGILRVLPEEPFGGKYIIDKSEKAQSTTYKDSLRIDTSKFSEKMDKN
ncbi:MAG TPA: hypothetical protein VII00_04035 [bacterium]